MAHMRNKTSYCIRCKGTATITANLDRGSVTWGFQPPQCHTPQRCLDGFKEGVFDRQFGASLIIPRGPLG